MFGDMGIPRDSAAGRRQFEQAMELRRQLDEPDLLKTVRRGWCLGDKTFRKELLEQMNGKMGRHHGGDERQESAEAHATRIIAEELRRRKWEHWELKQRRKGDSEKVKIALRLRKETTMTLNWIAHHLHMGTNGSLANSLRRQR